jgi:hypothetical protein
LYRSLRSVSQTDWQRSAGYSFPTAAENFPLEISEARERPIDELLHRLTARGGKASQHPLSPWLDHNRAVTPRLAAPAHAMQDFLKLIAMWPLGRAAKLLGKVEPIGVDR